MNNTSTEQYVSGPKPGYKTTEFWLALITNIVGSLMASGAITDDRVLKILGTAGAVLTTLGYTASRVATKNSANASPANADTPSLLNTGLEAVLAAIRLISQGNESPTSPGPTSPGRASPSPAPTSRAPSPATNSTEFESEESDTSITEHHVLFIEPGKTETVRVFRDAAVHDLNHLAILTTGPKGLYIDNVVVDGKPLWTSSVDGAVFAIEPVVVLDDVVKAGKSIEVVMSNNSKETQSFSATFKIWAV